MILKQCLMTNNLCYKAAEPIGDIKRIIVHSTGANNPYIKRYVQPSPDDVNRAAIIADIGDNRYNNSWNETDRKAGVHAFIGKNASDIVEVYNTMPYTFRAWAVGSGSKGSYNDNSIQFETCEDDMTDKAYFEAAMKAAQEYCAYICKMFGLTEKDILSHNEAQLLGYGVPHDDPHQWLKKYGKSMTWFREEVAKLLQEDDMAYEVHIDGKYEKIESANAMVALLGTIGVKATVVDTEPVEPIPDEPTIKAGDRAMLQDGATWYTGKTPPSWVYNTVLTVLSVSGDAAVVSADGENYTGTANINDLIII